jgi:hypothetical protein
MFKKYAAWGAVCLSLFVAGCSGETTYEKKDLPEAKEAGNANVLKTPEGRALKVSVMPVSCQIQSDQLDAKVRDKIYSSEFKQGLWTTLEQAVDAAPQLERIPRTSGIEADRIVRQTMEYASGMLPASEFQKVKGFNVNDRFIYGAVQINLVKEESLKGADKLTYLVAAHLRLGLGTEYVQQTASARDADLDAAVKAAITAAVNKYRVAAK